MIFSQKTSKNKLYSLHAPEVECTEKGKAHKRYEFGMKVSVVSTHKNNFIIGAESLPKNPYVEYTLTEALDQIERLIGRWTRNCFIELRWSRTRRKK